MMQRNIYVSETVYAEDYAFVGKSFSYIHNLCSIHDKALKVGKIHCYNYMPLMF